MSSDPNVPDHGLEELQKKLYDRAGGDFKVRRSDLDPVYKGVNQDWPVEVSPPGLRPKKSIWFRLLLWSFIFFLAALGVAYYL
ncbi:MAG: hypothetical protein NTY66_02010, partial [Candidatus Vogelbacteria bacterium]|nr:hypothetical protein [Candidatus Vogelbacteria bacterium]